MIYQKVKHSTELHINYSCSFYDKVSVPEADGLNLIPTHTI